MVPDEQLLREKALEVITGVVKEDKLHEFTYGTFRKEVEQALSLEPGTLDARELKDIVHAVAKEYISQLEEAPEEPPKEEKPAKKRKSAGAAPKEAQPRKSRAKSAATAASSKKASKSAFRSAMPAQSVVPSSDEDAGSDTAAGPSSSKPTPRARVAAGTKHVEEGGSEPSKLSKPPSARTSGGSVAAHNGEEAASPAEPAADRRGESARDGKQDDPGAHPRASRQKSDSEMSVLIDETPVRKRKRKGESGKAKAPKGKKRGETAGKELTKDEETVKRLKSLVVACGVRKVWAKEFKDVEKPADQIRRLKKMLTDLGMSGRMSLEQAKAIKAKREFEQELATEDVQEFASKIKSGPSASRRKKDAVSDNEEESEIEVVPKRKTARQSIMAFLGDESE
ncbi:uncharacterized protein TRAVEDRAFT_20073 [Trametes versicolor FP-101664 SS1]|uniref:uncharacterized protein n=1 Tax=Trametes versicolor (strain FP-101664) TaxID=717944 RepID=UPI000462374C|nr:uncharacterized protein TRAVEDRAFT_20073 [Trametes versicolor FP-101664 SS1]EIW59774.1 hypothetical protein TRAVEDRAFT_20073 [Trametes versicolor FP-101664 SS1]